MVLITNSASNDSEQDYLQLFLSSAYSIPMLSREREVELAMQMKQGGRLAQRARDELVNAHIKLVIKMARKMKRSKELEDVIQEGNIGLLQAVDRFEVERGFRFATYAWHWVRQSIKLYVSGADGDMHIPVNQVKAVQKLSAARHALYLRGVAVTDFALAREMNTTVAAVQDISETALLMFTRSINETVSHTGEDPRELGDFIPDTVTESAEDAVIREQTRQAVHDALAEMDSERDRAVLSMRFGIDGEGERTLEEVSQVYNITRERVRQIEKKALTKLKKLRAHR
jgi:RNA polymerase primary sigma factor